MQTCGAVAQGDNDRTLYDIICLVVVGMWGKVFVAITRGVGDGLADTRRHGLTQRLYG